MEELQKFAFAKKGAAKYTPLRVQVIKLLLDKSLPDLASVKHEVEAQTATFVINTEFRQQSV